MIRVVANYYKVVKTHQNVVIKLLRFWALLRSRLKPSARALGLNFFTRESPEFFLKISDFSIIGHIPKNLKDLHFLRGTLDADPLSPVCFLLAQSLVRWPIWPKSCLCPWLSWLFIFAIVVYWISDCYSCYVEVCDGSSSLTLLHVVDSKTAKVTSLSPGRANLENKRANCKLVNKRIRMPVCNNISYNTIQTEQTPAIHNTNVPATLKRTSHTQTYHSQTYQPLCWKACLVKDRIWLFPKSADWKWKWGGNLKTIVTFRFQQLIYDVYTKNINRALLY